MEQLNFNGLFPNVTRAYEIAKLGNFKITVFYNGGSFTYPKADEDYQLLKAFYHDVEFKPNGEIFVEIIKPKNYDQGRYSESLEDVHKRIEKAKKNPVPDIYSDESTSDELLKVAVNKLSLSSLDVKIIQKLAGVIAQLDTSDEIEVHHIAEAIHYRSINRYDYITVIAEDNTIEFGSSIKIRKGDLYFKDVEKAINYLKTFL